MAEAFATSFTGVPFYRSERRPDGVIWHVLRLEGAALEPGLATAWLKLAESNQLRTIWPGGPLTISEIFEWGKRPTTVVFVAFVQTGSAVTVVGLGWGTEITSVGKDADGRDRNKAEVGMAFIPAVHGTGLPEDMAEAMIDYLFEKVNVAIVFGTIPTPNALAVQFAKRMGFRHLATAPSFGCWPDRQGVARPCPCEIFVATEEEWMKRGQEPLFLDDIPSESQVVF